MDACLQAVDIGLVQPTELQAVYVLLTSDQGSYISGAAIPVRGGVPFI